MTPEDLIARAQRAALSAHVLAEAGDTNGACNRAYYAIFDAARAALWRKMPEDQVARIRTHNGLIVAFSQNLVKSGEVSTVLGKVLNSSYDLRQVADYSQDFVSPEQAAYLVAQADLFVTAMTDFCRAP